jgi:PAS domain S-box-containing protein
LSWVSPDGFPEKYSNVQKIISLCKKIAPGIRLAYLIRTDMHLPMGSHDVNQIGLVLQLVSSGEMAMDDFPASVLAYLHAHIRAARRPAYLLVDGVHSRLLAWGGELTVYDMAHVQRGHDVIQYMPVLAGLLPLSTSPLVFPDVEMSASCSADLHLFPTTEGDWIVLLDATQEVTQRRLLQQKVNDLNLAQGQQTRALEQYHALLEGAIQGILIQQDWIIRFVNQTTAMIFGYNRADALMGIDLRNLVAAPERARLEAYTAVCLQGDPASVRCEWQGVRRDGTLVWIEALLSALQWEHGPAILITLHDLSERKCLEAQLLEVQKMATIGALTGGIAHDFNNILTAIMGYTELTLLDTPQESATWRNLEQALAASRRARELVQHLLTFYRHDTPERQPLALPTLVKEVLILLRASLPTTIAIRQSIDERAGRVHADATQIHQVLMNLCTNAEYAMRERGGILEVKVEAVEVDRAFADAHTVLPPGAYVRLSVRDTGSGIAPETLQRIFDPFFTTKKVGEGTGMGLTVVRSIVADHGGTVAVTSVLGGGTTFEVYLPCVDEGVSDISPSPEMSLSGGQESILFVEDEPALAHLGQEMLTHLGYDVVASTSSQEALDIFRITPQRFDLVITDQTMPQMTGETLSRELRRIRPDIPLILCTGFSHTLTADTALALGIDAFLMKPLTIRDLAAAIRRVLA